MSRAVSIGSPSPNPCGWCGNRQRLGGTGWPRNEQGQTYGSGLDATSSNNEPDLILAKYAGGGLAEGRRFEQVATWYLLDSLSGKTPDSGR